MELFWSFDEPTKRAPYFSSDEIWSSFGEIWSSFGEKG